MSYLSTTSPAGCSQERVMDVGDWEGEAKMVGVNGTGVFREVGVAVVAATVSAKRKAL